MNRAIFYLCSERLNKLFESRKRAKCEALSLIIKLPAGQIRLKRSHVVRERSKTLPPQIIKRLRKSFFIVGQELTIQGIVYFKSCSVIFLDVLKNFKITYSFLATSEYLAPQFEIVQMILSFLTGIFVLNS